MPMRMNGLAGPSERPHLPRRVMLSLTAVGLLGLRPALAQTPEAAAEIARVLAGRTAAPGGITLDVPSIAENGLVVPLSVEVDSPMTAADHVTAVHVVADGNPNPLVATFRFTPESGRAATSVRIRLAQTQNIVVIAETSAGALRMASAEVKVTIGGCGG